MKYLVVIVAWLFLSHATALANPVRVVASGTSFEEAKLNGFRTAVGIVSGSVIVANTQVHNNVVTQNEVLNYSSGFVEKFNIVNQSSSTNIITLVMDIWVAESKIADRILGLHQSTNQINGINHSAQIQTLQTAKQQGDQLLSLVLKDYPNKAFTVNQQGYSIVMDNQRQYYLTIPVEIRWNQNYINSLNEVIGLLSHEVSDGNRIVGNAVFGNNSQYFTIIGKKPENLFFGYRHQYQIRDSITFDRIKTWFANNYPMVMLELKENNHLIFKRCYQIENGTQRNPLYFSRENFTIFGNNIEKSFINLKMNPSLQAQLEKINNIEVSMVTQQQCM